MHESLQQLVERLKGHRRLATWDEAATKQGVILPLLTGTGWDTFNIDEVSPEFAVGSRRVDFALRIDGASKVFIEVKRPGEKLEDHQGQLLRYSFEMGVKLAALTNGTTWWLYLPLQEGSWEQRKYYSIDIVEQSTEAVASSFMDFLSRENVADGKALRNAEVVYAGHQKAKKVSETLPMAWNKLISEADELLIELLSETTEKLCGHRADDEVVESFLIKNEAKLLFGPETAVETAYLAQSKTKRTSVSRAKPVREKAPKAFVFMGREYKVSYWREILVKLCDLLAARHRGEFDKVMSLRGRKRRYFSREPDDLFAPKKLSNVDMYVEVNLSGKSVKKLCVDVLDLFGYGKSDLVIVTK